MNVLDLFSGIGGFTLGLERAGGFRTVAFCESSPWCRRLLAKHWPGVPCYLDVCELTAERLRADGITRVDVVTGGWPCIDLSVAGKGAGLTGHHSGLWVELARIIGEVRPRYALLENVAALVARGLGDVLGDLAALGYDAEWHCLRAADVGAPHIRDRIWILAYPDERRRQELGLAQHRGEQGAPGDLAHRCGAPGRGNEAALADASVARLSLPELAPILDARRWAEGRAIAERGQWASDAGIRRVAVGIPDRVHRLRHLGNSLVPQIPEIIGRAILQHDGGR